MTETVTEDEQRNKGRKVLLSAIYIFFLGIVVLSIFIRLGAGEVLQTDEATHGVNAYEMLRHGNALVNTYKYAVDYFNSKPPLSLWCIMLSYRIFGTGSFGLRFASAISGCLLCIIFSVFLKKNYGAAAAISFTAAFPLMTALFEFHMFRAGDMDAIYCLLFGIAMIALYETSKGKKGMLQLYGAAFGLAFLAKSIHAGVILVIGCLFLPCMWRNLKRKSVILAALIAAGIPGIWALARFRFDGTGFLYTMVFGEASDKIRSSVNLAYLQDIVKSKIWIMMLAVLLLDLLTGLTDRERKGSIRTFLAARCKDNYLYILWLCVPVLLYSCAGSHMPWYIYTSYIAAAVVTGITVQDIVRRLCHRKILLTIFMLLYCTICLTVAGRQLQRLNLSGTGGNPGLQCYSALQEFKEKYGNKYNARKVYIENNDNVYAEQGVWENDYVFYAETSNDFRCCDGGVKAFLQNHDGLLLLDKDLWDTYSKELTGYVILEDDSYLIISTDKYSDTHKKSKPGK